MAAYQRIGRLRPGYYLIAKDGRASIVTPQHLPAQGQGFSYYWLGSNARGAEVSLLGALQKLGLSPRLSTAMPDVSKAQQGPLDVPLAKTGLAGLLSGVQLVPLPASMIAAGTGDALAGGAGAETGAAEGAAAGGAGTATAGAGALSKLEAAGTVGAALAALFDPQLLTRVIEIIGGVALLLLGLRSLTGGAVDPVGLATRAARA